MNYVESFGKATVANFSCGFDVLGFSMDNPGDKIRLTKTEQFKGVRIKRIEGTDRLSKDPLENTAGFAVLKFLEKFEKNKIGIEIELEKNMPLGSGMGSSASSAAAALIGINRMFGDCASEKELLEIGLLCETLACGSAHADNIAPSLFGGIVLIRDAQTADYVKIPVPDGLFCMIVHPNVEINTKEARSILPHNVPLKTAVKQWANIAALVSGLYENDFDLIRRSLKDHIIEPKRSKLIPHFSDMRKIALKNNLFNLSISGSGPSVFSLSDCENALNTTGCQIKRFLSEKGIESQYYISQLNPMGSYVINCEV
jgi:homoserine kinase